MTPGDSRNFRRPLWGGEDQGAGLFDLVDDGLRILAEFSTNVGQAILPAAAFKAALWTLFAARYDAGSSRRQPRLAAPQIWHSYFLTVNQDQIGGRPSNLPWARSI